MSLKALNHFSTLFHFSLKCQNEIGREVSLSLLYKGRKWISESLSNWLSLVLYFSVKYQTIFLPLEIYNLVSNTDMLKKQQQVPKTIHNGIRLSTIKYYNAWN